MKCKRLSGNGLSNFRQNLTAVERKKSQSWRILAAMPLVRGIVACQTLPTTDMEVKSFLLRGLAVQDRIMVDI
jgi:hypothetical protein